MALAARGERPHAPTRRERGPDPPGNLDADSNAQLPCRGERRLVRRGAAVVRSRLRCIDESLRALRPRPPASATHGSPAAQGLRGGRRLGPRPQRRAVLVESARWRLGAARGQPAVPCSSASWGLAPSSANLGDQPSYQGDAAGPQEAAAQEEAGEEAGQREAASPRDAGPDQDGGPSDAADAPDAAPQKESGPNESGPTEAGPKDAATDGATCGSQPNYSACAQCCVNTDNLGVGYQEYVGILTNCLCKAGDAACTAACGSSCTPPDVEASAPCSTCIFDNSGSGGACAAPRITTQCTTMSCREWSACATSADCFALKGP